MDKEIRPQQRRFIVFYVLFGCISALIMLYFLTDTIIHFTTSQQFPINSFSRFPLTLIVFPAELFSFLFSMYFVYNLIHGNTPAPNPAPLQQKKDAGVAVLVPVFNEPAEVVHRTLNAIRRLRWEGPVRIYLLDDSNNAQDQEAMAALAKRHDCKLVRREGHEGYKAGNINNAIKRHVTEEYFVIFDSDQAPSAEFLEETMDHFSDPHVSFVQTAQYFGNGDSPLERAQQLGTDIFYQSQCVSKAKDRSMPFCGTNVVVRTSAFKEVNGFSYYTATEDIELGLKMNAAGYHGAYVPKILVVGYAPTHFNAYRSQQYRWANGNLAILRDSWHRILLGRFSFRQQVHIFFTSGWWLIGITTLLYILVPILSLMLGGTHHTWLPTWLLGLLFLNVVLGITMVYSSLQGRRRGERVTIRDALLQYSLITNSMFIYARASLNALFGRYIGFVRTSKKQEKAGLKFVKWNLALAGVCFIVSLATLYGAVGATTEQQWRTYLPLSIWMLFYTIVLTSSVIFVGKSASRERSAHPTEGAVEMTELDAVAERART